MPQRRRETKIFPTKFVACVFIFAPFIIEFKETIEKQKLFFKKDMATNLPTELTTHCQKQSGHNLSGFSIKSFPEF
jgi:hypothetical protein